MVSEPRRRSDSIATFESFFGRIPRSDEGRRPRYGALLFERVLEKSSTPADLAQDEKVSTWVSAAAITLVEALEV